jgi:hypothetical protein
MSANDLDLSFDDPSFDLIHLSAVLEQVGGHDNQVRLIAECAWVARKTALSSYAAHSPVPSCLS